MLTSLPILILETHSRCNCRCGMCDIWRSSDNRSMTSRQLAGQLDSIDRLGVKHVVFTGGDPLMNQHLFELCPELRKRGIRITLLSSGILLHRFAGKIQQHIDEVIVSLDGPEDVHDRIRGVPGAFSAIARGVRSLGSMPVSARCVVQRKNCHVLLETVDAAEALGLRSISFLAADVSTPAFGRKEPWPILRQDDVSLTEAQLPVLEAQIQELQEHPLVADSPAHLARILHLFRAYLGIEPPAAPRCNAPLISAYLRLDGSVQPCFFRPKVDAPGSHLYEILNSPDAARTRQEFHPATDPVCQRCVCSLHYTSLSDASQVSPAEVGS